MKIAAIRGPMLCLCLVLAACASPSRPIRHLQLSAGDVASADSDSPVIVVDAVSLPDYLLRDELLFRDDEYTLYYDPFQRWAEPLDLGIQRVLASRLEGLIGSRQVVRFPDVARGPADWHLRIEFAHFEVRQGTAVIRAEGRWASAASPDTTTTVIEFEEQLPLAGDDGPTVAAALSELLWRFSAVLADPLADSARLPQPESAPRTL